MNHPLPPRPLFAAFSLIFLLASSSPLHAQAPDLTVTGEIAIVNRAWTWNMGATGMRGWIYSAWPATMNNDDCTLFAPYQILVTTVVANTPAAGVMAVDDVILGASAGTDPVPLFTTDARKSMGRAIGDAEARVDGILSFKRWRAGVTTDVSISLPYMGAYSDTAPYDDCPKSVKIMKIAAKSLAQRMIASNWGQDDGRGAISALALMATPNNPADSTNINDSNNPNNININYMPMVQAYARRLVPAGYVAGGDAWHYYNGVFLAEYYMLTNDPDVLPGLREYVIYAAKNSDLCGTTGHGFATLEPPGGWENGRHGSIAPYGALNQAGLIAQLTIVLGKKAGIVDPEIDPAIDRAAGFFGYYVNGGSIPYGEHQPWWGEHQINGQGRQYYDHRSNGKDGLCAVLFSCMDDKSAQAEYFSRMCLAGTRGEAYGHTGQGFAYIWTELGANMGGKAAGVEYAKNKRWDRDLKRRCDGSFVYEGGEQWAPGQAYDRTVNGQTTSAYWDNTYEYWGCPTATYLLHATMPLKKLYITGKGLDPQNPLLSPEKVSNALWAGEFASVCGSYTKEQLIAALGAYDPIARLNAATELATRWLSGAEVNSLITMAENPADIYQRNGACTALGCMKATSAIPALTRRLKDPDMWVRSRAALALANMSEASLASSVPDMADAFISNVTPPLPWDPGFNTNDPLQMANGFLAGTLFGTCSDTLLNANKNLLYPAVRVGLKQPTGNCRGQLNGFVEYGLSQADVQALFPELVECAKVQTPMDTFMGGYPPIAAMKALSRTKVQEGIQVINDNVSFYKSWALDALPNFGEEARWTLPDLRADVANWQPSGGNYTALINDVAALEAATTSSVVYALPHANPQIGVTAANTAKAITLTGFSCRTNPVACVVATQPAHGTLTGYPPNLTYTPAAGYQGVDSFTFTATDSMITSSPATVNLVVGTGGSGLTGSYYNNMDFTAFLASRVDSSVNFDWGTTPPNGLSAGTYSVRWTGLVLAPETGTYRFSTRTSDGVRLWINGVQVINDWNDQAANIWNDSAAITLTAGHQYHLEMEYYNNANPATARLYWYMPSRPFQAATIIPQELLYPVAGVCLTSPQDGTRFGVTAGQTTTVTLTADASDVVGTVASVSFYNGGTLIGTDTTAPYSFTWTNVAVGEYDITAKAKDGTGVVLSTSAVASITVDGYTVPVTTSLACHFDAAVGVATDASGFVKTWQDRSGNGHHATFDSSAWNSGTATVAQNQIMTLPAVQVRGGWFDIAGKFFAKEQYVVVRSLTATWNGTGAFIGRKSYDFLSVRASSYTLTRGGTGFWDPPLACSKNGVSTMNLAPLTDYMVLKITVDNNASPENLAAYPYCQIGRTENESGADWDVAEIIAYGNALSPSDEALVGGYLTAKYGIATAYPATGSLANKAATAITTTSATLNATLKCNSNTYDVVAYWGPVNGGTNPANWANSAAIGSGINSASIDLTRALTSLTPGTTYYFKFRASNAQHSIWPAAPQSFTTVSTAKDFLTFGANVPGSSAVINSAAGTVAWTVPYGSALTNLAPAYTVSAQATGSPASGATLNFSTPRTYTLTGQDGSTKVYTVTVAIDNIYPASSGATLTAAQDVATALTAANFGYADPNSLALAAVQITALPLQGTLRLSGTAVASGDIVTAANIPNLTYQPVLYANGTPYTTIGIKVMNSNNVWSIADSVMTVNVAYANHPPTSTGAALTMKGGSYYTFWKTDFPFTDVDAGDWLTSVKVTSLPAHGTLTLGGTPITTVPSAAIPATSTNTLIYTPNSSYIGADSFNYQVSDGKAFSTNSAMAITVVDPNLIFVANGSFETPGGPNGPDWAFVGAPWTHTGGPWGQVHRTGTNMPALTGGGAWIANLNDSGVGVLTQNLLTSVGAGDTLTVTFFVGRDSGGSGVLQASFMIDGTAYSQNFDTSTQTASTWQSYTLTKTIIEPGNLSLRFSNVSGHVSWLDLVSNVTITPAAVVAANAPTSTNATLTAVEDTPTTLAAGNFGYSDPNSAPLAAVRIISLPTYGTLKLSGTAVAYGELPLTVAAANIGNLTYQSALNGNGTPYTTFWISVQNTTGLWSNAAMMTLNVTGVNDAPVANAQSVLTAPDTAKAITLVGTDVEGSALTYTVVAQPAHGTLSGTAPNVTYTPTANYNGADSFTFKVNDGLLDSAVATVTITVKAANRAPVATTQSVTTAEDTAKAITLAGTDVDLDALTYAIVSTPAHGTLSGSAPNVTYTPTANYNGDDSFTFKVNDGTVDSAPATVTITVTAVNDAPTSTGGSLSMAKNTVKTFAASDFPFADVDAGDTLGAIKVTSLPANGTLSLGGTPITSVPSAAIAVANIGTLTYTPTANYLGAVSFNFQVRDASLFSADATMAISVIDGTTIPVINGNFETEYGSNSNMSTNWVKLTGWTLDNTLIGSVPVGTAFSSDAEGGSHFTRFTYNDAGAEQNLNTTVSAGDTLSVTFNLGVRLNPGGGWPTLDGSRVKGTAYFKVGSSTYSMPYDLTGQTVGVWHSRTFTTTITNTGALSLGFKNLNATNTYYTSLDGVSNVTRTSSGGTPTITTSGTLSTLSTTYGTASATTSFTVSGANMTAGIAVTPPAGFEVSQTVGGASGYAGSGTAITVGSSGTIASTTVYVRLAATATVGSSPYSGIITCVSSGATTQNVATASSTVSKATPTATLAVNNSPVNHNGSAHAATVGITASSVAGAVQSVLTGGAATQTAAGTYAVTANFVPTDTTNYNTLTGLSAGNFVITAATYASWATTNGVTGGVTGDPNHDGVQNGIAYFMGVTGPVTNPGITGNTVTWTNGGNIPSSAYGSQFVVQTSPDLVTWTPVAGTDPKLSNTAGSVSYTLAPGADKTFVRLVVTPN